MGDKLSVKVAVILSNAESNGTHVDWDMKNTKESQGEHCWNGVKDVAPMDKFKFGRNLVDCLL